MLNIVMLAKDRPVLTVQALTSLLDNTQGEYNLTIVDDGSAPTTAFIVRDFVEAQHRPTVTVRHATSQGPGKSRNHGIEASQVAFGRGDLLYLCDNDCYFCPAWDTLLLQIWNLAKPAGFRALGGYCHPYQRPVSRWWPTPHHCIDEVEALGLLSWLWEWETWDKHGPFAPSATINGSEDWAMSQEIRKHGGKVGSVAPALVVNCGLTGSNGKQSPGADLIFRQHIPEGVVLE